MARCDFLDFEAEESGGDCEEEGTVVKTEADLKRGKFFLVEYWIFSSLTNFWFFRDLL